MSGAITFAQDKCKRQSPRCSQASFEISSQAKNSSERERKRKNVSGADEKSAGGDDVHAHDEGKEACSVLVG